MSPRPVDKEEKKKIIVNAALQVFKTKGYADATVEEIAVTAKMGKGTIYEYFKSKEEIVQKLIDDFYFAQENRFIDFHISTIEPKKAIRSFLNQSFSDIDTTSDIIPVFFEFWSSGKGKALGLNRRMSSRFERMTVLLNKFLREGKKQKVFHETIDSKTLTGVIISAIDGLILYHALFKPRKEAFHKKIRELEGMIAGYIIK